MSRYDRPAFNPSDTFEARRNFTYNGVKYTTGKNFPWRKIACSPRKLRDMYNGNFILSTTATVKKPKKDKKPAKKAEPKAEKPVEEKAEEPKVEELEKLKAEEKAEEPVMSSDDKSNDEDIKAFVNDQK